MTRRILTQQRLVSDIVRFDPVVDLNVLPPLCPVAVAPTDFRHAGELIDRARRSASRWLDREDVGGRRHPERLLASHSHNPTAPPSNAPPDHRRRSA